MVGKKNKRTKNEKGALEGQGTESKRSVSVNRKLAKFILTIVVLLSIFSIGVYFGHQKLNDFVGSFNNVYENIFKKYHLPKLSLNGKLEKQENKQYKKDDQLSKNTQTYDASREVIPQIVKEAQKGVVSIAISDYEFEQGKGPVEITSKIGTGFLIDKKGLIVTNRHVVSQEDVMYTVITWDNKSYPVKKIVRDPINDIAFVFIDVDSKNNNLKELPLGDSSKLLVGQTVIAIGTPLGEFPGSVTVGVISGLGRTVEVGSSFLGVVKKYENVIQTDAAINPGNSGGPLLNLGGEVIGVNFAKTNGADNISFALPINLVKQRLAEYKKYKRLPQPFLGVAYTYISPIEAKIYDLVPGAFVTRVVPDSPAAKAGIKPKDIIVELGNEKVDANLAALLYKHSVGDEIKIKVARRKADGKFRYIEFKVKIADRYEVLGH